MEMKKLVSVGAVYVLIVLVGVTLSAPALKPALANMKSDETASAEKQALKVAPPQQKTTVQKVVAPQRPVAPPARPAPSLLDSSAPVRDPAAQVVSSGRSLEAEKRTPMIPSRTTESRATVRGVTQILTQKQFFGQPQTQVQQSQPQQPQFPPVAQQAQFAQAQQAQLPQIPRVQQAQLPQQPSIDLTPKAVAEYLVITGDFQGFQQAIDDLLGAHVLSGDEVQRYKTAVSWEYETLLQQMIDAEAQYIDDLMRPMENEYYPSQDRDYPQAAPVYEQQQLEPGYPAYVDDQDSRTAQIQNAIKSQQLQQLFQNPEPLRQMARSDLGGDYLDAPNFALDVNGNGIPDIPIEAGQEIRLSKIMALVQGAIDEPDVPQEKPVEAPVEIPAEHVEEMQPESHDAVDELESLQDANENEEDLENLPLPVKPNEALSDYIPRIPPKVSEAVA